MIDINELRQSLGAIQPEEVAELLDRLEAAEKDIALKERIIDSLGSELNAAAHERDDLLARIREMERQEPVAWVRKLGLDLPSVCCVTDLKYRPSDAPESSYIPLYLAPGAKGEEK